MSLNAVFSSGPVANVAREILSRATEEPLLDDDAGDEATHRRSVVLEARIMVLRPVLL